MGLACHICWQVGNDAAALNDLTDVGGAYYALLKIRSPSPVKGSCRLVMGTRAISHKGHHGA